jgi:hypothetical protein
VTDLLASDENGDFQFRPVRPSKAWKVTDDNIFVNDSEIGCLQRGRSVIVLVYGRKAEANFSGTDAVSEFGRQVPGEFRRKNKKKEK